MRERFLDRSGVIVRLQDGPGGVYVPETSDDWTLLGMPAPSYQWGCQDASGSLTPAIGAVSLSTLVGAGRLYQQTVTGWTRKFVGWDNRFDSYFVSTDAATTPGASESFAMLAYVGFTVPDSAARTCLVAAGGDGTSFGIVYSASKRQAQIGLNTVHTSPVSGVDYGSDVNVIRPVLFGRNCTSSTAVGFTNLEQLTTTYASAAVSSATKGWISLFNSRASTIRGGLLCMWRGADAETILQRSTLIKLRWTLPY